MLDNKFSKMRFLIVDDFGTMRRIIRNILKHLGYQNTIEAENGEQALKIIELDREIDFIISDWNMPVMTGLEFLKQIKSDEIFKSIPFLMVTAEAQQENIIAAVQSGVDNYIVKPFTPETLDRKIDLLIKKYYMS